MQNQEMTDGLSYTEAIKIYLNSEETGDIIEAKNGSKYAIKSGYPWFKEPTGEEGIGQPMISHMPFRVIKQGMLEEDIKTTTDSAPYPNYADYRNVKIKSKFLGKSPEIIKDELEKCLRARRVSIRAPKGVLAAWVLIRPCGDQWRLQDVSFIHTALSAGWDVEIVEGVEA